MIPQLEKRLNRLQKKMSEVDEAFKKGVKCFDNYFWERYEIDKEIARIFELNKKKIKEQEFTESQLDFLIENKAG